MKNILIFLPLFLAYTGFTSVLAQQGHQNHNTMDVAEVNSEYSLYHNNAVWTNHRNNSFQLSDLKGKPVIITMFYGNCTQVCPILIRDANRVYKAVDKAIRSNVRVLAITFDPENDTPVLLHTYADEKELNLPEWHFVTGSATAIRELAMMLGVQYTKKSDGHFAHSNLVTILDGEGKIVHRLEGLNQPVDKAALWIEQYLITNNENNHSHANQ